MARGRCLTCKLSSEAFPFWEGDSYILLLIPKQVLVLGPRLVLGGNLVSCLLQGLSPGLEGQEEKGSKESEGPHG